MKKKPINKSIWGLIDLDGRLTYWADTRRNCLENRWDKDEKLIKLKIVERE